MSVHKRVATRGLLSGRMRLFLLGSLVLAVFIAASIGAVPRSTHRVTLASTNENALSLGFTQPKSVFGSSEYDWLRVVEEQDAVKTKSDLRLKIVTYNIRHGEGLDNVVSLDRIASILKSLDADLIALQEVDRNFGSRSNWEDQAEILAKKLGMYVAFGPALSIPRLFGDAGYYGNAVLSRYPIQSYTNQVINFSTFAEARAYLHTVIETPAGNVNFLSTHLGLKKEERGRHVADLLAYTATLSGPVIVAGDFNAVDASEEIQQMLEGFGEVAGLLNQVQPTLIGSEARIDYLFISPDISVYDVATLDVDGSDHRPVMGLVSIPLDS